MGDEVVESVPVVAEKPKSKKWIYLSIGIVFLIGIVMVVFLMIMGEFERNFVDTGTESVLDQISFAQKSGDYEECDKISEGTYRDNCYLAMAHYLENSDLCEYISEGDYKEYCLRNKTGRGYSLDFNRTVWSNFIPSENITYNAIKFLYNFDSEEEGARGLFTFFLGDDIIYEADEMDRTKGEWYMSGTIQLDKEYSPGEGLFSIRVVPLTEAKSGFGIKDLELLIFEEPEYPENPTSCINCSVNSVSENSNVTVFKINSSSEMGISCSQIENEINGFLEDYSFSCIREGFFQNSYGDGPRRKVGLPADGTYEENHFYVSLSSSPIQYTTQFSQASKGDIFVMVLEWEKQDYYPGLDMEFGDMFLLDPTSDRLGKQEFYYTQPGTFIIFYPIGNELTEEYYYLMYHGFDELHVKEAGFLKKK